MHSNTRLYTGREYDKETSLYLNRARYYDGETGRFISRDPIGQVVGILPGVGAIKKIGTLGKFTKSIQVGEKLVEEEVIQKGYKSFYLLKKAIGDASPGMAWHHIVEKNVSNIKKFGAEAIHSIDNVIEIPHEAAGSLHRQITAYYNSIDDLVSRTEIVRKAVNKMSFQEQYEFGINVIKKLGGGKYLK